MRLLFANCAIDSEKGEVLRGGQPVPVANRVQALLYLLAENPGRVVTKDEIVERVWDGQAISDAAISTAVKEARQAVGDDGSRQEIIKTIHGRGFRLVVDVQVASVSSSLSLVQEVTHRTGGKPAIAILPFCNLRNDGAPDPLGDAISAELISAFSRLRSVSVTARGSSFRFRSLSPDMATVRNLLGVGYCLSGVLEAEGSRLSLMIELARTSDGTVIWADRITGSLDLVYEFRERILRETIGALELHIPQNEADAARRLPAEHLDAWGEYHIGLQHLYRFNARDNLAAHERFQRALTLDADFARAHAGLSFVAFQSAFMGYGTDRDADRRLAERHAERSLELDALDPFGNYCMARAKWMSRELETAEGWLARSVDLSPNFAQGHYLKSLIAAFRGESAVVREGNSLAMTLSPLDPFRYAMLGTQTMSFINDENFETAAEWGLRAAQAPGAHYLMGMVAAMSLELAGRHDEAIWWAENTKLRRPDTTVDGFLMSFPFNPGKSRDNISRALVTSGFPSG